MSSSGSAAARPSPRIEALAYREADAINRAAEPGAAGAGETPERSRVQLAPEELNARLEASRREGERTAGAAAQQQLDQMRDSLLRALHDFDARRRQYFEEVESEVVQLALGLARKILHRESNVDPTLLLGLVRVAIEQLEEATRVVVRVQPQNVGEWRNYFVLHLDPQRVPEVVGDPAMEAEGCVIETSLGSARLGVEAQMREIETGLLELMARRPGAPHE